MSVPTHTSSYSKFSHAGVIIEASQIDKIPPGLQGPPGAQHLCQSFSIHSSSLSFLVARRAPPPPPPRFLTSQSITFPSEDPFNDSNSCTIPIPRRPTLQRTRFASQSYTVRLPSSNPIDALLRQQTAQRAAMERETR
ncbi:hypothetical protein K503DRAFT_775077, partial [Rhizopogon vinicolor AM-OR11-026]